MARRSTKLRDTIIGTAITFALAVAIPWGPGCLGCELNTSPVRPAETTDDDDAGDE